MFLLSIISKNAAKHNRKTSRSRCIAAFDFAVDFFRPPWYHGNEVNRSGDRWHGHGSSLKVVMLVEMAVSLAGERLFLYDVNHAENNNG